MARRNGAAEPSAVQGAIMNARTSRSIATLLVAASASLAAAAAPARIASLNHPLHEIKAGAIETCSSDRREDSNSSSRAAKSFNNSDLDEGIEHKSENPKDAGSNRPPE